ncbi:MAG: HEAT repeat domain-containing protein [Spirochaetes bacterium]|nr:HEAT repeat domain-containing protein [Spirochaetota bacterium]
MGLFKPNIEKLKKANNIAGLTQCLNHKSADVRYGAFSALASRNDLNNDLRSRLKSMLDDPSPKVRTIATMKFTKRGDKTTIDNLMEIINKGTQSEKIELLRIIAGRGKTVDQAIMQAIGLAMVDKKELVKIEAIETAGATGNSHFIPNLLNCLHDNLHTVRIQAAKALYKIEGAESVGHLIGLLVDRNPEVQKTAYAYLSSIDSERARNALHDLKFQRLVNGMNDTESVRRETALKIGEQKIREGLPLLYTALDDEYKEVRIAALNAIAAFRDPSSVDFVAKMLEDKYHDARLEAVKTLGRIFSKNSLKTLEGALKTGDRNVREEAQKAIYKLRSRV